MAHRGTVAQLQDKVRKYDMLARKERQNVNAVAEGFINREEGLSKGQLRRLRRKNNVDASQYVKIMNSDRKKLWDSLGW